LSDSPQESLGVLAKFHQRDFFQPRPPMKLNFIFN
jgi:hypothetical protein